MTKIITHIMGTGNLAHHLVPALYKAGMGPALVYGRDATKAQELATHCHCAHTTDIRQAARGCDMLILCLSDDAIAPVLEQARPGNDCMVVHTAGSTDIGVLDKYASKTGVLYPLQSFSKDRELDFSQIPLFLEAKGPGAKEMLSQIAGKLSRNIRWLSSEKRLKLHLAAVFACNYVNHMYALGEKLVLQAGLDFEVLAPLLMETAHKAIGQGPAKAQTGPALREDKQTMEKHLKALDGHVDLKKLYEQMAQLIIQSKQKA